MKRHLTKTDKLLYNQSFHSLLIDLYYFLGLETPNFVIKKTINSPCTTLQLYTKIYMSRNVE
jgi:hypothetical protein